MLATNFFSTELLILPHVTNNNKNSSILTNTIYGYRNASKLTYLTQKEIVGNKQLSRMKKVSLVFWIQTQISRKNRFVPLTEKSSGFFQLKKKFIFYLNCL